MNLRNIIKKVFPRVLLKKCFLIYNAWKANTWDRLFFREEFIPSDRYFIQERKNPFLALGIDTGLFDGIIREKFGLWSNPEWTQDQYLLKYLDGGFIEPRVGWCVSWKKNLIFSSLGFASAPHVKKPSFFQTYIRRRQVTVLEKIISLRDTGEENYFHFFNDVLSKIFFLEENEVDISAYTFVISKSLFERPYFKHFQRSIHLSSLKWHVQDSKEWIKFNEAIFCKPFTHTKQYYDRAVELVRSEASHHGERRIFLTRSPNSLRFIENMEEIEPILKMYNFEIVDASTLDLKDQVKLFSQCRYLVAIHGAGITNIIFRQNSPLSLLEIAHPMSYIPFHYIMICKLYNFQYEVMMGFKGRLAAKGGFRINSSVFGAKIKKVIGSK